MRFIFLYLHALVALFSELWLYLVIGFIIAGAIAEFVPRSAVARHFGCNSATTVIRAMLAGLAASLCSCGAIPIAVVMRAHGASKAAAMTFMLAAPWTGVMQLVVFYKFLGFTATAVTFVGAVTVGFLAGLILGMIEDKGWMNEPTTDLGTEAACGCACTTAPAEHTEKQSAAGWRRIMRAGAEAKKAFLALWKYLAAGILLAALIKAFVPVAWVMRFLGPEAAYNPVLAAVPLAAAVELCSEGFSVFAGQLYNMGATLGAVFVLMMVGVTTDFTELSVIWGKFGKRSAAAYLITATTLTVIFGILIQQAFP